MFYSSPRPRSAATVASFLKRTAAHSAQRAVFVPLFEPNFDIPSYSCEVLLPTPPQNGEGDLCYFLKYIIANKSSLSSLIRERSFKFERKSTYFKSKFVEIPQNTTLDHGTVITAKVVIWKKADSSKPDQ